MRALLMLFLVSAGGFLAILAMFSFAAGRDQAWRGALFLAIAIGLAWVAHRISRSLR